MVMAPPPGDTPSLELLVYKLNAMERELLSIKSMLERKYVTVEEFRPVKAIVYGLVALMGAGIIAAILATILKAQ